MLLKTYDIETADSQGKQHWLSFNAPSEEVAQQEMERRGLTVTSLHERLRSPEQRSSRPIVIDGALPIEIPYPGAKWYMWSAVLFFVNGILYSLFRSPLLGIIWFAGSFSWYYSFLQWKEQLYGRMTKYGILLFFPTGRNLLWGEMQTIEIDRKKMIVVLTTGERVKIPINSQILAPILPMLQKHLSVNNDTPCARQ